MARLNIAMLGEQEARQVQEPVESSLQVLGSQVEDSIQQAQRSQDETDQMGGAVEDAQQATEDLMQEAQAAENAAQLPEQQQQVALESIQRNVKSILKTVGLHQAPGFAMESRSKNTKIALEGVGQEIMVIVKKIWDKIKEVWNKVVGAIKTFLKDIFDAGSRLKRRAIQIKEATKKLGSKKPNENGIADAPSAVKQLMRRSNYAIAKENVNSELTKLNDLTNKITDAVTGPAAMSEYNYNLVLAAWGIEEYNTAVSDEGVTKTMVKLAAPVIKLMTPLDKHEYYTHTFLGDRIITLDTLTGRVDVKESAELKHDEVKYLHHVLDANYIDGLCDTVIKQMAEYEKTDKVIDTYNKFVDELKQKAEKKDDPDATADQVKIRAMYYSAITTRLMTMVKDVATKVRLFNLQINKAAIDWCAASLKEYK